MEYMLSSFWQSNAESVLFCGMLVLMVCAFAQLHRIKVMNRNIEEVVRSVEEYLTAVMAEENVPKEKSAEAMNRFQTGEKEQRRNLQEEQSRLVSAVLQEFFP